MLENMSGSRLASSHFSRFRLNALAREAKGTSRSASEGAGFGARKSAVGSV